jgi:hypothetical protein
VTAPSVPRSRAFLAVLAPVSIATFWLTIFPDPRRIATQFVGRAAYGAYQSTLLWYTWWGDHLLQPSTWLHADFQRYPFGIRPLVLWAGDWFTATLFTPFRVLPTLLAATNAFVLALLAANVLAMAWVLVRNGSRPVHAALLGLMFGASSFVFDEIRWGRFPQAMLFTLPLFLDAWLRALDTGRARWMAGAAVALGFTFHVYPYYGAFAAGAAILLALLRRRPPWRRLAVAAPVVLGGGALLFLPVALAMFPYQGEYGAFGLVATRYAAVAPLLPDNFEPIFAHSVYLARLPLFLLDPALVACAVGLAFRGRVRTWSAVGLLGLIFALGPWPVVDGLGPEPRVLDVRLPFWFVVRYLPGWSTFSHPVRALVLPAVLGIGVLAVAVGWLDRRLGTLAARHALTALLALGVAGALFMRGSDVDRSEEPPTYPALATLGDGRSPLILVPLGLSDQFQYAQIVHRRPTLNANGLDLRNKASPEAWAFLHANSVVGCLRSVQRAGAGDRHFAPEDLRFLLDAGFREVVYVQTGREGAQRRHAAPTESVALRNLTAWFGEPVYRDDEIVAFDLRGALSQ